MGRCCEEKTFEGKWYTHPPLRNALIAGGLAGTAFILAHLLHLLPHWGEIPFYSLAILLGGYHWIREGVEELIRERKVGIEILMMAATLGSILLGMWDEAAFLVFLYGAAEGLEEYTYAKTRSSIRKLLDLAPQKAHLLKENEVIEVPAESLQVGDRFLVKPGERVPTDGIIVKGRSSLNEATVTGESIPVEKKEGMKVFAATLNQEGVLEIQTTASFQDNTLSKIIHLVEEAQEQKSKTQAFIERFGNRYSPLVLLSALFLLGVPYLLGGELSVWGTKAVVLLVAAAPCALIMSTPVAIAAGIGIAGKNGVLIKGGMHLENLGKIRVLALDKTGTLTQGKPKVAQVIPLQGSEQELLQRALSLERFSEHPLAQAIVEKTETLGLKPLEISEFQSLTGSGVQAIVGKETLYAGKPELFEQLGLSLTPFFSTLTDLRNQGQTVILIGSATQVEGLIGIRDEIRPEAQEALQEFRQMGLKTVMLTGDNLLTANLIAAELGIEEVHAHLKPVDKIRVVQSLEQQYGRVAMVGDGVNDAPALAQATVGIAMGVAGSDAALEAADVALMADDLKKVSYAIHLGRKAKQISMQNIVFSLILLALLIPAALLGWMSVAITVLIHELSEMIAVGNGLRVARRNRIAHEI